MNPPTLRPARSTDAGKLGQMLSDAVAAHAWKPVLHSGAEDIAHAAQMIDRGWVTVAETDGDVTGFLARDGKEVNALFVAGHMQGNGIGKALLDDAKRHRATLTLWTFRANTGARRFYAREGFEIAETTDGRNNDEGLPDIRFTWHAAARDRKTTCQPPASFLPKYSGGAPQERGAAPPSAPSTLCPALQEKP